MFSRSSAVFDEPTLVSSAGLVPMLALADRAGLRGLCDDRVTVPTDKGANAGAKITALVAGMVTAADSWTATPVAAPEQTLAPLSGADAELPAPPRWQSLFSDASS